MVESYKIKTERLHENHEGIERAGEILRSGGLVAFPTETVYGLGANALDQEAVRSVYNAKGRPSDNPMIVHISDEAELGDLVTEISEVARVLIRTFWPGPITFVFKAKKIIPRVTTGGLDTVAIRMPSSETARKVIAAAGRPIAAPSANLSGKPSPTKYEDVLEDMDGRIDAVVLGHQCEVGIESTVLDLTEKTPVILRPGRITKIMLEEALRESDLDSSLMKVEYDPALLAKPGEAEEALKPKSPGMKYKHYSPKADVRIVVGPDERVKALVDTLIKNAKRDGKKTAVLDYEGDNVEAARDFFARLRELDRERVDLILVHGLAEEELGFSVMNRMLKSAGYDVVKA